MKEKSIQSMGGEARAKMLSEERRREIARAAAATRWGIPKATHEGDTLINGIKMRSYVLDNGTRVLNRAEFIRALGRKGKAKGGRQYDEEFKVPVFLTASNLKSFISQELLENSNPIIFVTKTGMKSIGYRAELLPYVCNAIIDASEAGLLRPNQFHIAQRCKILIRGLAHLGIIALVDEATGYQEVRDRQALQAILEKYLTDEWAKWTKTFPDDFYKELFRLKNMAYPPTSSKNKPSYVGHWTNDIIYSRLAPGVLDELRKKVPITESGHRKRTFHSYLTRDYGHPKLKEHLTNVIFLMKGCSSWNDFHRMLDRAAPKFGKTIPIEFTEKN